MRKAVLSLAIVLLTTCLSVRAQQTDTLNIRQQNIVLIAATTARGDLQHLKTSLARGLDDGMTVNEIKEVLVHAYAYCGFPRSLRALQTFMEVLDERKAQGIMDPTGREASPIADTRDKYTRGAELLEELSGAPKDAPKTGYAAFAPIIEQYLKEHLFCDIFERDLLTWQERELATVSILSAMGTGVKPMLKSHSAICLRQGITKEQLRQMTEIVNGMKDDDPFARGTLLPDNPNFTDKAWLQGYVSAADGFGCTVANVTFAPGCRNSWHSHKGGQLLLCTSGKGYYQEKGKPIQLLLPGDVVKIAPDVVHWHGAAPDSEFRHIAIGTQLDKGGVTWLEPVTDEEYNSYKEQ